MNYRKGGGTENGDVFVYALYIQHVCMYVHMYVLAAFITLASIPIMMI